MKYGYARISHKNQNINTQLEDLRETQCDKIIKETISGVRNKWSHLDDLLLKLKEGDELVITRLDRLGRSLRHFLKTIDILEQKGVKLLVLHENIDTTTPIGKLVMNILISLSEMERNWINERTRKGIEAAKRRGVKFGRHPGPVGPSKETVGKWEVAYFMRHNQKKKHKEIADFFKVSISCSRSWVHQHKKALAAA